MLLGLDRVAMVGGKLTARDYVQNGLICLLDGIENAGWGIHDPSATTWTDLTGTLGVGVVIGDNSSWADDALVRNVADTPKTLISETYNVGTVELISKDYIRPDGYGQDMLCFSCSNQNITIRPWKQSGNWYMIMSHRTQPLPLLSNFNITSNTYSRIVCTFSLTSPYYCTAFYGDGVEMPISTFKEYSSGNTSCINLGNTMRGKIHAVRIYNRALTAAEIAANYAVDRARFGLT